MWDFLISDVVDFSFPQNAGGATETNEARPVHHTAPDFVLCTLTQTFHVHEVVLRMRTQALEKDFKIHDTDEKRIFLGEEWWDKIIEMLIYLIYMHTVTTSTKPLSAMATGNSAFPPITSDTLNLLPLLRRAAEGFHVLELETVIEGRFLQQLDTIKFAESQRALNLVLSVLYDWGWGSDHVMIPFRNMLALKVADILSEPVRSEAENRERASVKNLLKDWRLFAFHVTEKLAEIAQSLIELQRNVAAGIQGEDDADLEAALGDFLEHTRHPHALMAPDPDTAESHE